jgi:hypothetical protein
MKFRVSGAPNKPVGMFRSTVDDDEDPSLSLTISLSCAGNVSGWGQLPAVGHG